MATTTHARRIRALKQRFMFKSNGERRDDFPTRYHALYELTGTLTLSRLNVIWCRKALVLLQSQHTAPEHGEMMDLLEARVARSQERIQARKEGREEKKLRGRPVGSLKPQVPDEKLKIDLESIWDQIPGVNDELKTVT